MKMNIKMEVSGHFKIEAVGPDGAVREIVPWSNNLVVNTGLDRLYYSGVLNGATCILGSGNTPPSPADTTMQSFVGASGDFNSGAAVLGNPTETVTYGFYRGVFTFQPGVADGNLSEIGIAHGYVSPSSYTLVTRALIKDGSGNPTTITILPNETLYVTYEARYYQPLTDATGIVNIAGINYDWTVRAGQGNWGNIGVQGADQGAIGQDSFVRGPGAALGPIYTLGTGPVVTGSNPSSGSVAAYNNGDYYADVTTNWSRVAGTTPFTLLYINTYRGGWQMLFSPDIPKSDLNEFSITYRLSWANRV